MGKLRENSSTGTEYTLYDNGHSPNKGKHKHSDIRDGLRRELVGIAFVSMKRYLYYPA